MLRQVCLTYGSQFHARTRVYFSLAIVVQIVAIVFLLLFLFNIVHVQLISALFVAVWTIVFFLLLAAMLLVSAEINSYFEEYRNLLEELNSLFQDVQRMSKHYF
jgi:cbb3-type cytochrome oxidase subunit 1